MRIYLETTIPNFLVADDAPEKKQVTELFFRWLRLSHHQLFISQVTIEEIEKTPEPRRAVLEQTVDGLDAVVLPVDEEARNLQQRYLQAQVLPARFRDDLLHVAVAVCHKMDMIVSWNMKHLANPNKVARINAVNRRHAWPMIRIHTPQEVLGL